MSENENKTGAKAIEYDTQEIIRMLQGKSEMDPDSHDGSYEMMRETIKAYAKLPSVSTLDYHDLNLIYLISVGTWKHGIDAKKKIINESHLLTEDKGYLLSLLDEICEKAKEGRYSNCDTGEPQIGMFGTGFYSFQTKTLGNHASEIIQMCIDIFSLEDENEIYDRAAQTLSTEAFKGSGTACISMILHCLKPLVFPILNANMGNRNIFEILGVPLEKVSSLDTL